MFQSRAGEAGSAARVLAAAAVAAALASRVASVEACRWCCARRARIEEGRGVVVVVVVRAAAAAAAGEKGVVGVSFERTEKGEETAAVAADAGKVVEYVHAAPGVPRSSSSDTGCSAQVRVTPDRSMVVVVTVSMVRCRSSSSPLPLAVECSSQSWMGRAERKVIAH